MRILLIKMAIEVGLGAAETLTQPQEVSASTIALSVEFCTASMANFAAFTTRCYCYGGYRVA